MTMKTFFLICALSIGLVAQPTPYGQPVRVIDGSIGGHTLITNISLVVDTTAAGVTAADAMMPQVEVANVTRKANGTSMLGSLMLVNGDDLDPEFVLLIASQPITWPATNAPATLVSSEIQSRLLTILPVAAADWSDLGTNRVAIFENLNRGLRPATNSLFLYGIATSIGPYTNGINATLTIYQD
jgi:hypothetical protein